MGEGEQVEKNIESDKGIRARLGKVLINLPKSFVERKAFCQANAPLRLSMVPDIHPKIKGELCP